MGVRFSLRQLEYLVAVADAGSITKAATSCGASQAGVSLGISDLEKRLGVQLLIRHKAKGVKLTAAGTRIVADARRVLAGAEDLQTSAAAVEQEVSGSLSIGCYSTLAPFFIPPVLDEFASRHPALDVHVLEGAADDVLAAVRDGHCEIAFLYAEDGDAALAMVPVQTTRPYLILAADHPLAAQREIRLAEIAEEPLIMFDVPSARNAAQMLKAAGLVARIRHLSPNIEVVRGLVARGVGYSILVQRWPADLSFEGRPIASRPIADPTPERKAVLAWPQGNRLTRRARALIEFCQSTLETASDGRQAQ
jgi:DNA-binding transcriptional LysR family regulator